MAEAKTKTELLKTARGQVPEVAPAELAKQFGEPAEVAASAKEAITRARARVGANGIVFVCGSLYLVGEAIALSRSRRPLPVGNRQ